MVKLRFSFDLILEAEDELAALELVTNGFLSIIRGEPQSDFIPLGAISMARIEENAKQLSSSARPPPNRKTSAKLNAIIVGGASYDRGVISTSVPPLEELNKEGTSSPDEDLL